MRRIIFELITLLLALTTFALIVIAIFDKELKEDLRLPILFFSLVTASICIIHWKCLKNKTRSLTALLWFISGIMWFIVL